MLVTEHEIESDNDGELEECYENARKRLDAVIAVEGKGFHCKLFLIIFIFFTDLLHLRFDELHAPLCFNGTDRKWSNDQLHNDRYRDNCKAYISVRNDVHEENEEVIDGNVKDGMEKPADHEWFAVLSTSISSNAAESSFFNSWKGRVDAPARAVMTSTVSVLGECRRISRTTSRTRRLSWCRTTELLAIFFGTIIPIPEAFCTWPWEMEKWVVALRGNLLD